jgi:hypothetical protein
MAVMAGDRGKARAMAVPTMTRRVAVAATAAWMNAVRAVSVHQTLSKPAS